MSPELAWREKGGRWQSIVPVPSRFRDPELALRNHFCLPRSAPETNNRYGQANRNKRGQVMFVSVLNVIYREFIKRALSGMATQGGRL
jgi:hypothetical protein